MTQTTPAKPRCFGSKEVLNKQARAENQCWDCPHENECADLRPIGQTTTPKKKVIKAHSQGNSNYFWKKPFGKCDPKKALPQDCFDIEGMDAALEKIHD